MKITHNQLTHETVQELLPAYLHGQLNSELQRSVQEHVAHCSECFARQQEDASIRQLMTKTPQAIETLTTQHGCSVNFKKLSQSVNSATRQSPHDSVTAKLSALINRYPLRITALPGLVIGVQLVIILLLLAYPQSLNLVPTNAEQRSRFQTLSATATSLVDKDTLYQAIREDKLYRVLFNPEARMGDIQLILINNQTRIVAGPGPGGVYTLLFFGKQSGTEMLQLLKQSNAIILAERASHSDW